MSEYIDVFIMTVTVVWGRDC